MGVQAQEAENEKDRRIGLGLGLRTFLVNDEVGSNLNYRGIAFWMRATHDVTTDRQSRQFTIYFASPKLSNDFNRNQVTGWLSGVDYKWRFRLKVASPASMRWYLGPYVRISGFSRAFNYLNEGATFETGDIVGVLGASSWIQHSLSENRNLEGSLLAPILAHVLNREFGGSSTNEWMMPDRFADYQLRLAYVQGTGGVDLFLSYQYNLVIMDRATRVAHEGHLFEGGLKFAY